MNKSGSTPSPLPSQTKRFVLHIDEIDMGMALYNRRKAIVNPYGSYNMSLRSLDDPEMT